MLQEFILKNGIKVVIRNGMESDAAGILDLLKTVAAECNFMLLTTQALERDFTVKKEVEWIRKFNAPRNLLLIAEYESKIVGIANIINSMRQRQSHFGTLAISISNKFCDAGLGSQMIKMLLDWADHETGIEKIALAVFADNHRAIHLYKKFGFIQEGHRIKEVKMENGSYADDILMYRWAAGTPCDS
jgi:RimJ/RimL family protein N-acetyltransferase